jgi:serine/threonine protein kinase
MPSAEKSVSIAKPPHVQMIRPSIDFADNEGHVRLTDFGLSKDSVKGDSLAHTFCGTPEYLGALFCYLDCHSNGMHVQFPYVVFVHPSFLFFAAPEVLQGQGHGKAVDWVRFSARLIPCAANLQTV